jgi:hypothetical protein
MKDLPKEEKSLTQNAKNSKPKQITPQIPSEYLPSTVEAYRPLKEHKL